MRRLLVVALGLLAAPLVAQQKLDRRIAIAADASIRIYNLAGATRVVGWDRDSIAVTGSAPVGTTFYMGGSGRLAKLGLEHDQKSKPMTGFLEVRVPRGARVWVKAAEGLVEVSGLVGEVDVSSVGGGIRVTGTLRIVTAESIEGDIECTGASPLVRIRTGGGKILLRQPGGDVTASTVSGPIVVQEGGVSSARLETVTGMVTYSGTLDRQGTLHVQTHSGDVELVLPPAIGAEFDLESMDGLVSVGLPSKSGKVSKGKSLSFAHAGGGAHIMVRTFKGQVRILAQ